MGTDIDEYNKYIAKSRLLDIKPDFEYSILDIGNSVCIERYVGGIGDYYDNMECIEIPGFVSSIRDGTFKSIKKPLKIVYKGDKLKYIPELFKQYKGIELDLSEFSTKGTEWMDSMFELCTNLKRINLSNFDTSRVTDMDNMFNECWKLEELDLSSFDTRHVENMYGMFNNCWVLKKLDVRSFDTSNVENMSYMFCNCEALKDVKKLLGKDMV